MRTIADGGATEAPPSVPQPWEPYRTMMLRAMLQNYVRQAAQQTARDALQTLQQPAAARPEAPCSAAVLCALNIEAGGLIDLLQHRVDTQCARFKQYDGFLDDRRIVVVETGEGVKSASEAVADVLPLHQPPWILSAGFGAALQPGLRRGEMLMASELVDAYNNRLTIPLRIDSQHMPPGVHQGRLLTLDQKLQDPAAKRSAGCDTGALAYDLESMAIAQACRHAKTRFLAVRVISETLEDALPPEWNTLSEQPNWAARLGAAAGALWNRPSTAKLWWNVQASAVKASDHLAVFLQGVLAQLR